MTKTTTVRGLRDGQRTAGTGFLIRRAKALGAKVTVAATGRVTVIDKNGDRHVYVLAFDATVDASPLTQAIADLESAEPRSAARVTVEHTTLHQLRGKAIEFTGACLFDVTATSDDGQTAHAILAADNERGACSRLMLIQTTMKLTGQLVDYRVVQKEGAS